MSVRRLAEQAVQPASFAFNRANAAWAKHTIRKYPKGREQSAVIPLLMRAQEQEGWVTKAAIEHVGDMLDMPYIRVLEVATFYTQFQLKPVGTKAHVQVCGTTPCMLRGSEALMDVCRSKIHHEQFHTNEAGTLSWEEVECLGACVNAPMVMIFKDTYEDLTPERLAEIIDQFEAGRGGAVPTGPQNGRTVSAPLSGLTSLADEAAVLKSTRDREAGKAGKGGRSEPMPVAPSQAAKPKTDAIETSPAIKSPSKVKVAPAAEKAASVEPPAGKAKEADKAAPAVEKTVKQRTHAGERPVSAPQAFVSPEALKGEPIGPAGKRRADEKPAPKGKPDAAAAGSKPRAKAVSDAGKAGEPAPEAKAAPVAAGSGATAAAAPAAFDAARPALDSPDRPAAIERPAQPDDLQLIAGIGPKNERLLHELGVYTFAQIGSWKQAEREWVDGYLRFKGRIEREQWVRQAEALAKGGEAEYVRVFGKKPR